MYKELCETPSDINEHLPVLAELAKECEHITEMGVRYCVSTWAFIEGNPSKLVCIDIKHPSYFLHQNGGEIYSLVEKECRERKIELEFIQNSTLNIEIEPTDLLFIDTIHTYAQLSKELELHSDKARKYIVLHDTVSCPLQMQAVDELVAKGKWKIKKHYENNNGLMVLCLQ